MHLKKLKLIFFCFYSCFSWNILLPGEVIINPSAKANFMQFSFSYEVTIVQDYNRVYLDTDHNPATGFSQGGIGANYLIENDTLYTYVGPGWIWSKVKSVCDTKGLFKQWIIQREDILPENHGAGSVDYLYQVESPLGISSLSKMSVFYPETKNSNNGVQKIAVPSYFYPCTGANCYWDQLNASKAELAIINPNSGPGDMQNLEYSQQVLRSQAAGVHVLGYVHTSYGQRSEELVKKDIDRFYQWYGVDGIFLDEGYSSDCRLVSYYDNLNKYIKAKGGKAITAVNFGTGTPECYVNTADILVIFESSYEAYLNWQPVGWEIKYPASKFWHLIYGTPIDKLKSAVTLSKERHAGWVYVTSDTLPNPWDTLPSYWKDEIKEVSNN